MTRLDFSARANRDYLGGLGRALAGAILFSLPMLMTMEMWWLGFYLGRSQLILFVLVNFLLLVGLSRLSGFEKTQKWSDDVMDAFAAYTVAVLWSALILVLLGIIEPPMPWSEVVGKIAIQSVPAGFGAMLGGKQMGGDQSEGAESDRSSYWGQLFLMMAGAMYLSFNVAPTEEMVLLSFRMTALHSIGLIIVSVILLHAMVYTVGLKGQEQPPGTNGFWGIFVRYSVVGYAIAALVSLYLLWTFGRLGSAGMSQVAAMVAVLAFPGAIGAAVARLIV